MLITKLNVASWTGTATKARSSKIFFGRWAFTLNERYHHFCRNDTHGGNLYPRLCESSGTYIEHASNDKMLLSSKAQGFPLYLKWSRTFALATFQEKADLFGDLGDNKFESLEMEESDLKEEEFLKNEAKPNRRFVPSQGRYADMIKQHINTGDLKAGLAVLDQIKKDRTEANNYMYNLLIRAFAVQGNLKKCFRLYNQMKKQMLKPNSATYVSLINACANSTYTDIALEKLSYMRQLLIDEAIPLTAVHYNAMIKAYGRHGKLLEAFQLVDEMRDMKLTIGISTLNFLLQGSISDKEAGFRHALVVWHLLRCRKLKPDIFTYNLLLRAARDCKMKNFKIEDLLVSLTPGSNATIAYSDRVNLLAHPPIMVQDMPLLGKPTNSLVSEVDDDHMRSTADTTDLEVAGRSDLTLPQDIQNGKIAVPINNLESSTPETNLLLMGGFNSFVSQMKMDNVAPDIKSVTYLMELVPPTVSAEKAVIKYAMSSGVKLDVDFYNLLIKKRSFRFDYDNALDVLKLMQRDNLEPNIMTWGVLALTCRNGSQVRELLEGMELSGHRMNVQIIGAILGQATRRWQFRLILELMEKMKSQNLKPNSKIFNTLETFRKNASQLAKDKNCPEFVRQPFWQNGYRRFSQRHPTWVKEMESDSKPMPNRRQNSS